MIVSTGFYYNDEYSGHKNVIKIRTSGGLTSESFLATVTNNVNKPKNSYKSFIQDTELEPLVIPMALYFDENLDEVSIRDIKRWLTQKDFKPLLFEDMPDRVFYAKLDGASNLTHNSISSGYVEFDFLTNSAYSFSQEMELEGDSTSSTEYETILVHNEGDLKIFPRIEIIMNPTSPTDIEIFNDTTGDHFLLKNNLVNETIIIWNEYEELETSSSLRHGYDDHNGGFISLDEGLNELRIKGKFDYKLIYQNIYL